MCGLDLESVRHRVKLVKDSGSTRLFENRDGVACPVCDVAFDEALVTREPSRQLQPDSEIRLCISRDGEQLFVFTHAGEPDSKN